jgi:hypothetical protein
MTKTFNDQRGTAQEVTDAATLADINTKKKSSALGKVVEWPAAFSTAHLTKLKADKRKLLVQIADDTWFARIQASEGIALSEYESMLKEHEEPWAKDIVIPSASSIFTTAFTAAKAKKSTLDESLFSELKGFLQLVVTYIARGQVIDMKGSIAKSGFMLMARTNFGSMHNELLSPDEKALFKDMLGDPKTATDNPILSAIEAPINTERGRRSLSSLTLNRTSPFFFNKVGSHAGTETFGPKVYEWLVGITKGKDLLSGPGISDAMGAKTVETKPGEKSYKQALFEVRGTVAHGGTLKAGGRADKFGNDRPASGWLGYARDIFNAARARSADTPDDPSTPKVDESSKTGLVP